ncbi:MAG: tetratricopeptide repeat protein [Gemmatimonadaceae bacterium]
MRRGQHDYSSAESLYRETYALRRTRLGDAHPDVANSLVNIDGALSSPGRYNEAEPLLRRGMVSKRQSLGAAHPDVATDMGGLADLLLKKGDITPAETLYRDVRQRQSHLLDRCLRMLAAAPRTP